MNFLPSCCFSKWTACTVLGEAKAEIAGSSSLNKQETQPSLTKDLIVHHINICQTTRKNGISKCDALWIQLQSS
jgi:hypothetical protein